MSFPAIFRRLFQKEGAGPLLRKEIIPPHADTHGAKGSDPITPESIGAMAANAKPGSASSADVAVKLKTSRAIDGMGFDGTKSIIHYAVCSTAAATAAKTVNLTGFVLEIGARILVRFDTTNTAVGPTLNVNGTGAKTIRYKNATVTASVLAAKSIREFVYDGAYWQIVGDLDSNTTYQPASAVPLAPGTAAVGTSVKYAREDHRHPLQTSVSGSSGSCTGNAATATKLAADCTIRLTGDATGSAKFDGSDNAAIATTIIGLVPVGGIVAFSGTFSGRNPIDMKTKKAMTGWCLCDGMKTNGLAVPDLRDRMIMGAGTTYQTGSKGGAATHTHSVSGTVGATTLTEKQLAANGHKMFADQDTKTKVTSAQYCCVQCNGNNYIYDGNYGIGGTTASPGLGNTGKTSASASHTHSLTGAKSGSASSLPPYYALAYIMRVA